MTSPLMRAAARQSAAPQSSPDADRLRTRASSDLAYLKQVHEVQAAIVLRKRQALAALERIPGDTYTAAWFQRRTAEIEGQARQALDAVEEAAATRIADIREHATKATERDPGTVQDQILTQLQLQNAWLAVRPHFDAIKDQSDGLAAIEAACNAAGTDAATLAAIKQFAPNHLAAMFASLPRADQTRMQQALSASITAAERPTWTPLQAAGHELLEQVDRGEARLQQSSREVRGELEGNRRAIGTIPFDPADAVMAFRDNRGEFPAAAITAAFSEQARAWSAAADRAWPLLSEAGAVAPTTDPRTNQSISLLARQGITVAVE